MQVYCRGNGSRSRNKDHQAKGTPPQINHPSLFNVLKIAFYESSGKASVEEFQTPPLGGEDFAYYSEKVPGFLFLLGCGDDKGEADYPLYNSRFDFDEATLPKGAAAMACSAIALLENKNWF